MSLAQASRWQTADQGKHGREVLYSIPIPLWRRGWQTRTTRPVSPSLRQPLEGVVVVVAFVFVVVVVVVIVIVVYRYKERGTNRILL